MDQVFVVFIGFAVGVAVLYGVVRLALSPLEFRWLAPPSGLPHTPPSEGLQDIASGHHHAP